MIEPPQTVPEETTFCEPHWERQRTRVPAARTVDGTPMCADCFSGVPTDPTNAIRTSWPEVAKPARKNAKTTGIYHRLNRRPKRAEDNRQATGRTLNAPETTVSRTPESSIFGDANSISYGSPRRGVFRTRRGRIPFPDFLRARQAEES